MYDEVHPAFETFLVEDVILTLGNLRGSLAWLTEAESGSDLARQRVGLARIDRQIAVLEDRAREVCRLIHKAPQVGIHPADDLVDEWRETSIPMATILADALGGDVDAYPGAMPQPEFRSRRHGFG